MNPPRTTPSNKNFQINHKDCIFVLEKESYMRDKQFIPFIHNYCDRWCEQCQFIMRCQVGIKELERIKSRQSSPHQEEDFVETVTENLKSVLDLLEQFAEENDIDWDELQEDIEDPTLPSDKYTHEQNQLKEWGITYLNMGQAWFTDHQDAIQQKEDELNHKIDMDVKQAARDAAHLVHAMEVVRWFLFFISVKIDRALHGLQSGWMDDEDPIQNDANGSAKVALEAIERSIAAWEVIRHHFEEYTDELIDIFVVLGRMAKMLQTIFPHAQKFVRPGFDEPQYYQA